MNELELWRRLHAGERDGLAPMLRALAKLPLSRRSAFLGLATEVLDADASELREAALAVLGGATGHAGERAIVGALDDDHEAVRARALAALRVSTTTRGLRWAIPTFHPRADVRRASLEDPPPGAEFLGAYLRADPALFERACKVEWQPDALDLVFDFHRRHLVSDEEFVAHLGRTSLPVLKSFLEHCQRRSEWERVAAIGLAPCDYGRDDLDAILDALAAAPPERNAFANLERCAFEADDAVLPQRVAAAVVLAGERRALAPREVALAIACAPRSLLQNDILPGRREAAIELAARADQIRRVDVDSVATLLRELDFLRLEDGSPDIRPVIGVASLAAQSRGAIVHKAFDADAIVAAVAEDLAAWAAWCALTDEPFFGARVLLAKLRAAHPGRASDFVAITLYTFGRTDPTAKGGRIKRMIADQTPAESARTLAALCRLLQDEALPTQDRCINRIAPLLGRNITARYASSALGELIAATGRADPALAWTFVEHFIATLAPKEFARAAAALPPPRLLTIIEAPGDVLRLRRDRELALAESLLDHRNAKVRAWASAIAKPPPRTTTGRAELPSARALRGKEARRISSCKEYELDDALAPALAAPCRGLAAALAERPEPRVPSQAACVALSASGDWLYDVAVQYERFRGRQRGFERGVERKVVATWETHHDVSALCHAWLHRWESHGFALLAWLDELDGGLASALETIGGLPSPSLVGVMWRALASVAQLRRYREPHKMEEMATDTALARIVAALDSDQGLHAARLLVAIQQSAVRPEAFEALRPKVLAMTPDMSQDALRELERYVRVDGLPVRTVAARRTTTEVGEAVLEQIRASSDIDRLLTACRSGYPKAVHEAALRLIELGAPGQRALANLIVTEPALRCVEAVVASVPLWTDDVALAGLRDGLAELPAELRFRVCMSLLERGEEGFVEPAIAAVVEPAPTLWFRRQDWDLIVLRSGSIRACALALAAAVHPHAYREAVVWLLEQPRDNAIADALRAFLHQGIERPNYLRRSAALRLLDLGEQNVLPLIVEIACDSSSEVRIERVLGKLDEHARKLVVQRVVEAALIGGKDVCTEESALDLVVRSRLDTQTRDKLLRRMLLEATDDGARSKITKLAVPSVERDRKLSTLAEVFAWGVRRGREHTSRLFSVHMTNRRQDLGYTWLDSAKIYVSPLPILRRERHGRNIVEGLVMHEIGHHMFHRGEAADRVWERAQRKGLHFLLNLIADEHLERNLRAIDARYGDRLKRLASYAFQHSERELEVTNLLGLLRAGAFDALHQLPMDPGVGPAHVVVHGGQLLRELDKQGQPFARFARALRMGLGNRSGDPLVAEAIALFDSRFRHNDMEGLWALTERISEMFGGAAELARCFGGHEGLEWSEREGSIHGDGIEDEEVQREVERILDPQRSKKSERGGGKSDKLAINVAPDARFERIETIEHVPPDAAKHRELAMSLRRHSARLRGYLSELGLNLVPQRARLRGRALDRSRVRAVVIRRDPRMLVARELQVRADLFVGVAIDCSSSMSVGTSMDKARRFGVLLAEAARGLTGVDARFFGFTDHVIYDAGDAQMCSVASLQPGGGNNDAAALEYAARVAAGSRRRAKLLVMISDGLPTECSVDALRNLVGHLSRRGGMCCAQIAVRPLEEVCFPHYVVLQGDDLETSTRRFGEIVTTLCRRALGR